MQADDPPYLPVGTAVSAKYKGAFCEAKVSKVVRVVKCKVSYKNGLGNATVTDDAIKGTLRVGQLVQAKHAEKKEFVDATITKIQDCSQYTVVFDDGDITTLRRTALCLKSGRHFNESETLDQLPLTHPEHFGNPVVGGRRGRRSRQLKEDSSEGEQEEENEPDLEQYSTETGKVVCVEGSEKKRSRDNWFPGLVVMPSAQPTVRINVKDEYLVRSFKDGRYYTVPKTEVSDFTREIAARVESHILAEAVEKVLKYLDNDELPVHWEKNTLFNLQPQYSDSEEKFTDSSDDEPREEKDHFVAQLYKFMDDSATPLNKTPTINNKDVDFYRLFRIVQKLGGYNRVTNQNKWRSVAVRLKFTNNQNTYNQVKLVYKKCLLSYECFYRTLGCTMLNHPRSAKKSRDRTLIRGKDRTTPVQSPRPDKEEPGPSVEVKKEKEEEEKPKPKKEPVKIKVEEKKIKEKETEVESSDTNSSGETTDQSETPAPVKETIRSKRIESKYGLKEKQVEKEKPKPKMPVLERAKIVEKVEKVEESPKKDEREDKVQQTRSKSQQPKPKEASTSSPDRKVRETRTPMRDTPKSNAIKIAKKTVEDDKKRGRKRTTDEKTSNSDGSATDTSAPPVPAVNIGDKLKVYYGPTHESKVTYEAKVIDNDKDGSGPIYLVHYTGWNNRYDEWIAPNRIAENLSATTKAKRLKQGVSAAAKNQTSKPPIKRGRGMSITGRSTIPDAPRSTTPSSVTSSSSRTKSPATPATRNSSRLTRQGEYSRRTRRTSVQTDNSVHTDTDTEPSESESEIPRTRSSTKSEENEGRPVRKKLTKLKADKRKDDEDTEKEEEVERPKRNKKFKKVAEIQRDEDSDDDSSSPPKGRDFDLNQIRSELKGFAKAVKAANATESDKDGASSDESVSLQEEKNKEEIEELEDKEAAVEKALSSDDIYEFKEPEPFEFESRKPTEEKTKKRLVPRVLDDMDKSLKRKTVKSPAKPEVVPSSSTSTSTTTKDSSEEKKFFKRSPVKKVEEVEVEEKEKEETKKPIVEDPFDKLVESPSFHIVKVSEKVPENKEKVTKVLNLVEPLSLFKALPDSAEDDCDERLDISDNDELPSEPLFTNKEELFSDSNFATTSPEHFLEESVCDDFPPKLDEKKKDSDDDDPIKESIQRAIAQTSISDDESNDDLLMNQPLSYSVSKEEIKPSTSSVSLNIIEAEEEIISLEPVVEEIVETKKSPPKEILTKIPPREKPAPKEKVSPKGSISPKEKIPRGRMSPKEKVPPRGRVSPKEKMPSKEQIPQNDQVSPTEQIPLKEKVPVVAPKQISPVFQETDSSLLEAMCATPQIVPKIDDFKDIGIKTGPKIADSLLQKLGMLKSKPPEEIKKEEPVEEKPVENKLQDQTEIIDIKIDEELKDEVKPKIIESKFKPLSNKFTPIENKFKPIEHKFKTIEQKFKPIETKFKPIETKFKPLESRFKPLENKFKPVENKFKPIEPPRIKKILEIKPKAEEIKLLPEPPVLNPMETKTKLESLLDLKKRSPRSKTMHHGFLDETDSDSSDSEERLVIARSDDDSQTSLSLDNKPDIKESDSNNSVFKSITDDSQTQEERNFKFETIKKPESEFPMVEIPDLDCKAETETAKEEEPDSHLHSLLLCEETIPGSPAPAPVVNEEKPKTSAVLEMPFASAPCSSNTKNVMINPDPINPTFSKDPGIAPAMAMALEERDQRDVPPVLDNTPPTTPESTLSNLSPRGDNGVMSPNIADIESCKSTEAEGDYSTQRASSTKVSPYSEEDTLMNSESNITKKMRDESQPSPCKKRRRSHKGSVSEDIPFKRGRKPNRSRHNSDSDDTSEHSMPGNAMNSNPSLEHRFRRSPISRKYNFYVDFDNTNYDRNQRIAIINQKIQEIKKCYQEERVELAAIEKRRKKIKRRKKENAKAAKQEIMCT